MYGASALPTETEDAQTTLFRVGAEALHDAQPLLGQASTLAQIRKSEQQCFGSGHARVLALLGSRGSGRTRLLTAAGELAAQGWNDLRLFYAESRPEEDGPYAPFPPLLLDRFAVTPASSPTRVRAAMAFEVARVLRGHDAGHLAESTHLLGHVAGIPFPESAFLNRHRALRANPGSNHDSQQDELLPRAAAALREFCEKDSGSHPTLLLLDGMRAEDAEALTLLAALSTAKAPLLCVVTGDSELEAALRARINESVLDVAPILPLHDDAIRTLTHQVVPELREPPNVFFEALQHRSGGNPAALCELLRALREEGLFRAAHDGLRVDMERFARGDLPLTMDDAIRTRLAQLSAAERRLIQHASVVGERFWDGALLALLRADQPARTVESQDLLHMFDAAGDELELHRNLERLEEKRFVVRTSEGTIRGLSEYTFQFAGTRAVVYEDLPKVIRARRHAVVARWLSTASGLESVPALLAPHYARAGMTQRAARAYLRAADEERRRNRTTMALRLVDRCLEFLDEDDPPRYLGALHSRGSLLTTLGQYDEAIAAFEAMLQAAYRLGSRARGAAALNRIARVYRQRGELTMALDYLKVALSLFRSAADERGVASTYDDMAQIHRFQGQTEPALSAAKEALATRVRIKDERGQAVSLNTIGNIELDRGNFAEAGKHLEQAAQMRNALGDYEGRVQTAIGLGRLALQQGEAASAHEQLTRALEAAREMDNQRLQSYLLCLLGEASMQLGDMNAAEYALGAARDLANAMRDQRALCEIECQRGLLALRQGREDAGVRLEYALDVAQEYGSQMAMGLAHRAIANLHSRTVYDAQAKGETPAALHFDHALRHLQECGAAHEVARTQAEFGLHLYEQGKYENARTLLESALPTLRALGLQEAANIQVVLTDLKQQDSMTNPSLDFGAGP